MTRVPRRPVPALDRPALERLALRYVERFATTRGRLTDYLRRKIRERGWDGEMADPAAIAERMAELGYIDDSLAINTVVEGLKSIYEKPRFIQFPKNQILQILVYTGLIDFQRLEKPLKLKENKRN